MMIAGELAFCFRLLPFTLTLAITHTRPSPFAKTRAAICRDFHLHMHFPVRQEKREGGDARVHG